MLCTCPAEAEKKDRNSGDLTASALSLPQTHVYMVWDKGHLAGHENKGPDQSNYISQVQKTKPLKLLVRLF